MEFESAARDYVANGRPGRDPLKKTLDYLLRNALGRASAKPIDSVLSYLKRNGIRMSKEQFQTTVLKSTRQNRIFIGSSSKGVFIIRDATDFQEMRAFYEQRIAAEQAHLDHLSQLARDAGYVP